MRPYSILLFTFLQLVTSAPAPAPDITYNPTKEAPCTVTWDSQTNGDATEHYEVNGHCMFTGSLDRLCSGGYVAPGFCPNENDRPVDCCISRKCGQGGEPGLCVNKDRPIHTPNGQSYYLFDDPACPSFWGAPAACCVPTTANIPPPVQGGGMNPGSLLPQPVQPEAQQPSQPMTNDLSFNNNNLWTTAPTSAGVNSNDGVGGQGTPQQQQQDVAFTLVNQQQPPGVAADGGGGVGAAGGGLTLFNNNQPPVVSSGTIANGDASDGIINPDGRGVDALGANGSARDGVFFDDTQ